MSEIDYDELDEAVTGVMGDDSHPAEDEHNEAPESDLATEQDDSEPAQETESESEQEPESKKPYVRPKPRGRYLDMVNRNSDMRSSSSRPALPSRATRPISPPVRPQPPKPIDPEPAPEPTEVVHDTEFGVIEDNLPEEYDPIGTLGGDEMPEEYDEIEIEDEYPEEEQTPPAQDDSKPDPDPAPDPEKYTLGGRSPFIENAVVEKRPLGDYSASGNPSGITSTKNVYSRRLPTEPRPAPEESSPKTIVPSPKRSGLGWFLIVIIILAVGALVGALAGILVSDKPLF